MIYLLGGPPRVGKSIIAGEIRQKHAVSVVSTDTLAAILEDILSPEDAPELFVFSEVIDLPLAERMQIMLSDPAHHIDYLRRESQIVWKAVEAFMRRENVEGRDALIEGVAILPGLVSQLGDIPHRVVFIGNQGKDHKENIKRAAEVNEHDWMRGLRDEYIGAFAEFVKQMSAYIEHQAGKYGFEYIEMDKRTLAEAAKVIMKALDLKSR